MASWGISVQLLAGVLCPTDVPETDFNQKKRTPKTLQSFLCSINKFLSNR